MGEESKRGVTVLNGKFFKDGWRINPFKKRVDGKTLARLIVYGIVGLILVRLGFWNSPPIDTFYFAFAFGLYLDVIVELLGGLRKGLMKTVMRDKLNLNISHSSYHKQMGAPAAWAL